jgi:hypothetical protein
LDLADVPLPAGESWSVVYNPNSVELEVKGATPGPSTWLLFGTALAVVAGYGMVAKRRTEQGA